MSRYRRQSSIFVSCIAWSFVVSIVQCAAPTLLPLRYIRPLSEYKPGNSDKSGSRNADVEAEGYGIYRDPSELRGGFTYKLLPLPYTRSPSKTRGIENADTSCESNANADGYGYFRDPLEVLGPRFPRACMATMCEKYVQMRPDNVVVDVRYTRRGAKMCSDVCAQYLENMLKNNAAVDVQSMPGYCDNAGSADGTASGTEDLGSACACGYKVRCDRHTELLMYSFETDSRGNVRVSVSESDRKHYVTILERLSSDLRKLTELQRRTCACRKDCQNVNKS